MTDKFKQIVDTHSPIVDEIIEKAMFHVQKEQARPFLTFMDNYLRYYLNQKSDGISFPILRIPFCPDWAREVFLKFLICRLAIYYNGDLLNRFIPSNNVRMEYVDPFDRELARKARRRNKYLCKLNVFKRDIQGLNNSRQYIGEDGHKNLIFCLSSDLMVTTESKNEFINEFYGEPNEIFSNKNVCICHDLTIKEIRKQIMTWKKNMNYSSEISIDNIFVFFTNNKKCKSLRKTDIERLNRICNTGIKKCFVFEFSDHPYRLAETLNRDKRLSFIYPGLSEKEYQNNDLFTTLNDEESKYLFSRSFQSVGKSEHWHAEDNDSWHESYFKTLIGSYTDNAEYWMQERNHFSICFSDGIINLYKQRLGEFMDTDGHMYDESFEVQKEFGKEIITEIMSRINGENSNDFAIVVDYYLPKEMSERLKSLFNPYRVKIYKYSQLRPQKLGHRHILGNKIKESNVFVLRYCPHNAGSVYAKYPNSFDPFTTNPGQCITEIIQDYVFKDKYLWDKYDYELEEYKHFNSDYRKDMLGGIVSPRKPNITRVAGNEDPDDEKSSARQNISMLRIQFEDEMSSSIAETDWVIYRTDNEEIDIAKLKDLKQDGVLNQIVAIQPLDEISGELYEAIIKKEGEDTLIEKYTRQSYYAQGLISEDERESDVYLWKILLAKKIQGRNLREIYDEIMEPLREPEKVQYGAFRRWVDMENSMMLPLQKTTQKRLIIDYLGLSPAYLQVMRSKKMAEKALTRHNNTMLDNFLVDYLLCNIDEDEFEKFKITPINEILQFDRIEDLKALIALLTENISLKTIKSINS